MTPPEPTVEEVLEEKRHGLCERGCCYEGDTAHEALDVLQAVLAIPEKKDAYAPHSNVDRISGYNQALSEVRETIEGEMK